METNNKRKITTACLLFVLQTFVGWYLAYSVGFGIPGRVYTGVVTAGMSLQFFLFITSGVSLGSKVKSYWEVPECERHGWAPDEVIIYVYNTKLPFTLTVKSRYSSIVPLYAMTEKLIKQTDKTELRLLIHACRHGEGLGLFVGSGVRPTACVPNSGFEYLGRFGRYRDMDLNPNFKDMLMCVRSWLRHAKPDLVPWPVFRRQLEREAKEYLKYYDKHHWTKYST